MIVIAGTTPLNYLVLIEHADVLPALYGRVIAPQTVAEELQRDRAPQPVRTWITRPPQWLEIRPVTRALDGALDALDAGERDAIELAEQLHADWLILDDRDARKEASRRHLAVIGTLRVLDDAAAVGLLDLALELRTSSPDDFFESTRASCSGCLNAMLSERISVGRPLVERSNALRKPKSWASCS